ncbi:MAG: single-stranded DNA-binding protein [Candidatus Melainabacteria bacterium]|nr:single-stranded DNA-binding protein [Candidatus Melainabacteria bacterium]
MSLSNITLSGTLKKDPEKRFTPTNIPVTNLLVEVCYIPRGSQAQQDGVASQTIRVNAWRDLAEECERKLKAGNKIFIVGRVQVNAYTSNEGKKKREVEVDANSITLLSDVLALQPPIKKEEKEQVSKPSFKKSTQDAEQVSTFDEVTNTEEIPF